MSDLVAGLFLVALLYILVRPSSKGAEFVTAFGAAMSAIVRKAADLSSAE